MSNESVFIGSSHESRFIAEQLCAILGASGIIPCPWWTAFDPGSITLPRLLEISKSVDGAIFLFAKDDEIWYSDKVVLKARDNVVLEWGIFVSKLGLKRCIILSDRDTRPPTDLLSLGLQYFDANIELSFKQLTQYLVKEFKENSEENPSPQINIVPDERLCALQVSEHLPKEWFLRAFYLGVDGAKAWLSISADPIYRDSTGVTELRNTIIELLNTKHLAFRTLVSLGPGDGTLDEDIIGFIKGKEPSLRYIPIDLSAGLLMHAYTHLYKKVFIPVGILADFEGHSDFVAKNVKHYGKSPMLYTLLGGTFGNLDTKEFKFLTDLKNRLNLNDYVLIDIAFTNGPPKAPQVDHMSAGVKQFYSHGAAKVINKTAEEIYNNFAQYVKTEVRSGLSDIPGTSSVIFSVSNNNKTTRFAFTRRYSLAELEKWIVGTLQLNVEIKTFANYPLYGRALLLLSCRP